ncbi:zinc finger protein Noc [Lingula anatina]|uniref:Zinc finger protein Noc n=1 Tax=Lingula anatina TaxID=7574 RepID=A0A1S3HQ28_LINAN|nr:zinc finger protein Noc [Lingula anatina]|eukprot:XP_013387144.1 zinc finger protein Noc [Lingula anatina]
MLTSSTSQYLHPDYLQPLPTTLDAKKSPLALLAQTCSSIGKDTTPSKPIIPPLEKKDHGKNSPEKQSPGSEKSRSERKETSSADSSKQYRSAPPKDIPPLVPIANPTEKFSKPSAGSPHAKASTETTSSTSTVPSHTTNNSTAGAQSSSRISLSCGNMLLEVNHQTSAAKSGLPPPPPAHSAAAYEAAKLGHYFPGLSAASAAGLPYPGYPAHLLGHSLPGLDPGQSYRSALAGHGLGLGLHSGLGLKPELPSATGGHSSSLPSPYVAYATIKTATGANTLVPICRDPYCTTCQINLQSAQLTCCASGCTQCNHEKGLPVPTSHSFSSAGGTSLSVPVLASIGGLGAGSSLPATSLGSNIYSHGLSAAHHGLPYVCNWVAGAEYCGKRFSTSEELLQHLRTHTSSSESAYSSFGLPYGLGFPSGSSLSASHPHYPTPGSLSPNTLRRLYPTSLSPVSRYHPYSKPPGLSALTSTPVPGMPLSSAVGAYYSPYSLYGRAAAVAP